jgi:hypothetical protein
MDAWFEWSLELSGLGIAQQCWREQLSLHHQVSPGYVNKAALTIVFMINFGEPNSHQHPIAGCQLASS